MKCPICKKPSPPKTANRCYPFCSDRCRLVDLGKWLAEDYTISEPLFEDPDAPEKGGPHEEGNGDKTLH